MIFKRLKKSTKEEEEQFGLMMEEEKVGCADKFAMLVAAFFTIMLPCIAVLLEQPQCHLRACQKYTFIDVNPHLLNQNVWGYLNSQCASYSCNTVRNTLRNKKKNPSIFA